MDHSSILKSRRLKLEKKRKSILTSEELREFNKVKDMVKKKWNQLGIQKKYRPFPYTPHDETHCEGVEEKLYELLKGQQLNRIFPRDKELFLLLCAIWLHDIGMHPELFDTDKKLKMIGQARDREEIWSNDREIRKDHAIRSVKFIDAQNKEFREIFKIFYSIDEENLDDKLNEDLLNLKQIIEYHRHSAYKDFDKLKSPDTRKKGEKNKPRIPFILAFLRLSDALQIPALRDWEDFFVFMILGLDFEAKYHWFKSIFTDKIKFLPEKSEILIIVKRPINVHYWNKEWDAKLEQLEQILVRTVQDELDSIKDFLIEGGYTSFTRITSKTINSKLNDEDIPHLHEFLGNIELFDSTLTPNASYMFDSVLRQIDILLANGKQESFSYLRAYNDNVLKPIIKIRPCHVMIRKLSRLLPDSSSKFDDNEKAKSINNIKVCISQLKEKNSSIRTKILDTTFGILSDGTPILLYGYSNTIVKCMKNALKNGNRNIVIFVCEGRAKTKYRYNNRLLYSDGIKYIEELKKAESELKSSKNKFEITLIPDSCASNLFSNDCISKVIFGANGIGLTGKVAHNLGHLAIADMAMRYSVPVYVIADSLKISMDIDKLDKTSPRDDPWLTTDINFEKKLKGIKFYNPRGDFVPPGVLTAIVTEKGIIAPNKIKEHYDSFLEDYVISAPMRNALKSP